MSILIKDKNKVYVAVSEEELGIRVGDTLTNNLLPNNMIVRKISNEVLISGQQSLELDMLERVLKSKDLKKLNYDMLDKEIYHEVRDSVNKFGRRRDNDRLYFPLIVVNKNKMYKIERYGFVIEEKDSFFDGPLPRFEVATCSLKLHKDLPPLDKIKNVYQDLDKYSRTKSGNIYVFNNKNDEINIIREV